MGRRARRIPGAACCHLQPRQGTAVPGHRVVLGLLLAADAQHRHLHRIYAFDADAYNFSQLQANIFLNRLDHVIVGRHAAVSDHAGTVRIQNSRTHEDGNRGATRVLSSKESAADETTRFVNAIAIDDVLTVKGTPIAIKLDVEAHEPNALRGMRNLIANNEIILQIEIYKEQTESVVPILRDMGLRQVGEMYPDYFYTNIPAAELGQ